MYTTQTIREEIQQATSDERAVQLTGVDFYLPLAGQPRISQMKSWRGPVVTEQGNPGIYVLIEEWLPLYQGNVYVVDEVTGRMYLSKKSHLVRIPEVASHRPREGHELSVSRHIPERETDVMLRMGENQRPKYPPDLGPEGSGPPGQGKGPVGTVDNTPVPVAESTPQVAPETQYQGDLVTESTVVPHLPTSSGPQEERPREPSFSLPPPTSRLTPPRPPRPVRPRERPPQTRETPDQFEGMTVSQAERVRKRRLAALAVQQILRLREQRDRLEEQLLQEFCERRD